MESYIMQLDQKEQVLIYDIESENNQHHQPHTRDEPEPYQPLPTPPTINTLTQEVRVRPSHHSHHDPPTHYDKNSNHTTQDKASKLQQVSQPEREEQGELAENIIFYEEEPTSPSEDLYLDETTRGLLKNAYKEQESEEDDEEDEDKVEELRQQGRAEERVRQRRAIVPSQKVLANQAVLVQAKTAMLLQQVVPAGYRLRCYLQIERGMLGLAATYRLFLGDERQFLLTAKKEALKYYSNFIISNHPRQVHKRSEVFVGRLEANFLGTQFKLYSAREQFQTLKLTVSYHKNIVGFMGPRTFTVTKVNPEAKTVQGGGLRMNSLSAVMQRNERSKLVELRTSKPALIRGKYRLDFQGKVRVPSSRNFLLEGTKRTKGHSLLFGKVSQDCYIVEVGYPLSVQDAFGVCLSSLDSKLMVN